MTDPSDDALLRRLKALRGAVDHPARVDARSASTSYTARVDQRARDALDEEEELQRIADGKLPAKAGRADHPSASEEGDGDDAFARRIASLKGEEYLPDEADMSDTEVDAYIASVSLQDPLAPFEVGSANSLLPARGSLSLSREADAALRSTAHLVKKPEDEDDALVEDPGETEEDIVTRAMKEAGLEANNREDKAGPEDGDDLVKALAEARMDRLHPAINQPPSKIDPPKAAAAPDTLDSIFAFPALPTHLPETKSDEEIDDGLQARMNLLLGLSGPTARPGVKLPSVPKDDTSQSRQVGQGWNIPGYVDARDDDIESWCCICNQDATLRCLGCEGDLYCDECWRDGHGREGDEEHKVRKFVWARKRAMGA